MFSLPTLSFQEEVPPRQEKTTSYRRETLLLPTEVEEREQVIFPQVPKRKKKKTPVPTPEVKNSKPYRGKKVDKVRFHEIYKNLPELPKVEGEKQGVTLAFPELTTLGILLPKVRE